MSLYPQRNMDDFKRIEHKKVVVPSRTISNPSPLKKAASNRHPGQTHTRTEIDGAMNHELAMARFLMQDLADHVLGHIVSTNLARDILQEFIQKKVVQVFDGTAPQPFNRHSSTLPGTNVFGTHRAVPENQNPRLRIRKGKGNRRRRRRPTRSLGLRSQRNLSVKKRSSRSLTTLLIVRSPSRSPTSGFRTKSCTIVLRLPRTNITPCHYHMSPTERTCDPTSFCYRSRHSQMTLRRSIRSTSTSQLRALSESRRTRTWLRGSNRCNVTRGA
ncbi:hypothetical protein L210DRAFT_3522827 [Boletus edulis BED1]|uniref:Uncharacterized protein n=1 Tax=Boletus edulis BED1 TaxID=1328754 RepID=A0AAD4GJS7_BOLED|nr:hypothetical protein L210DRAFT_3522827 [Boletus edulis BED1]